jgi:hypothetical protein
MAPSAAWGSSISGPRSNVKNSFGYFIQNINKMFHEKFQGPTAFLLGCREGILKNGVSFVQLRVRLYHVFTNLQWSPRPSEGLPELSQGSPRSSQGSSRPSQGLPRPSQGSHRPSLGLLNPIRGPPDPPCGFPDLPRGHPDPPRGRPDPPSGFLENSRVAHTLERVVENPPLQHRNRQLSMWTTG